MLRALALAICLSVVNIGPARAEGGIPANLPQLVAAGDFDAARVSLRKSLGNAPDLALHLAHLEGLIALAQGNDNKAERIFREILTVEPRFVPARRELTALLLRRGDQQAASYQASLLLPTTRDEEERALIERLVLSGQGDKKWGIVPRLYFSPSTNLNRGPADTDAGSGFVVDGPKSGIGLTFGLSVWRNFNLGENWRSTLTLGADRKVFQTDILPAETTASLRFDVGRSWPGQQLAFGLKVEKLFRNRDNRGASEQRLAFGFDGRYQRQFSDRLSGLFDVNFQRQIFAVQQGRDGWKLQATPRLDIRTSPGSSLSVSLPLQTERTALSHQSHDDFGLKLAYTTQFANGLTLTVGAEIQKAAYIGNFPGRLQPRLDVMRSVTFSASHPSIAIAGVVPTFGVTLQKTDSNIPILSNSSADFQISLSRNF